MPPLEPLIAASVPSWVWATLVMAAFVAVTVLTMLLARYPLRRAPPPIAPPAEERASQTPADPRGDASRRT